MPQADSDQEAVEDEDKELGDEVSSQNSAGGWGASPVLGDEVSSQDSAGGVGCFSGAGSPLGESVGVMRADGLVLWGCNKSQGRTVK